MTGAARGIGQAIAAGLAEHATRIVVGDIDDVSQASDLIGATGHPAVLVTPDVSDPSSIEAAHDADSGLGGFHTDVADAKSFYSDVLDREKSGVAGVVAAMLGGPCCACGTDGVLLRGGGALGINGPRSCCGDAAYCGCGPAGVPG